MRTTKHSPRALHYIGFLFFYILTGSATNAQTIGEDDSTGNEHEVEIQEKVIYWHIKAVLPEAKLLDVKAIDKKGNYHDVKAIQDSYDISLLSVKALVNGQSIPIKMIAKENDEFYPIKAVDYDGTILDIKAIGEDGELLDVKGVSKMGNIIDIRAIDKQKKQYNVISISPQDGVNHVKGLKMFNEEVEAVIHGVKIFAHVKSLRQY